MYNWNTFNNQELAKLIRNGGIKPGFDTNFNREMVEEAARRIDRAATLEAENADLRRQLEQVRAELELARTIFASVLGLGQAQS